jgi:peptidyl-dipeptidase Dcp
VTNPFFSAWTTPYETPPFDLIETKDFQPAYDEALELHRAEIAAIGNNQDAPTFENTIAALECSGKALRRVDAVFSQLSSAATNEALQAVEREVVLQVARHWNGIFLDAKLFARIDTLYNQRDSLGLDSEALRVLERYHLDFVRAGARLTDAERDRFGAIVEKLASLGTQFGQNVLADEQETVFALTEAEMDGLPDFARAAAAETARDRKLNAPIAVTPSRSSVEPILHFAKDRKVREKVWRRG